MVVLARCAVSKKEVSELILLNENTGKLLMELGKW